MCNRYPVKIIEVPYREDDLNSFAKITTKLGNKICVVDDQIFVTNKTRVPEGIKLRAVNSIIIKVNQGGTLTAAMEAIRAASSKSWRIIASHRSGETKDDWLADFSIGIEADAIKAGANIPVIRNSELIGLTVDETRRNSYIVIVVDQYNNALRI